MSTVQTNPSNVESRPITLADVQRTFGTWHPQKVFKHKSDFHTVTVAGLITGCGLQQLMGLSTISTSNVNKYKEIFKAMKEEYMAALNAKKIKKPYNACQTINAILIGTLGYAYWDSSHEALLSLGFKVLAEYQNTHLNHPEHHKQRLYMINLLEVNFE